MGKLTKHAAVMDQIHQMVLKRAAEAQTGIKGEPGADVKAVSVGAEHEQVNKNAVKPENVPQGISQKPSEDPSEPAKTAAALGMEVLEILGKQADAQDTVTGKPGDVKAESVKPEEHKEDKNSVKPENNKQKVEQAASTDSSAPTKKAEELAALANKVASYKLGRDFAAVLLKAAAPQVAVDEMVMAKEAGRRDFDNLVAHTQAKLAEKQAAEQAGAAYFDTLLKEAALNEALAENEALKAKVASHEEVIKQASDAQAAAQAAAQNEAFMTQLSEKVAAIVIGQLKSAPAAE